MTSQFTISRLPITKQWTIIDYQTADFCAFACAFISTRISKSTLDIQSKIFTLIFSGDDTKVHFFGSIHKDVKMHESSQSIYYIEYKLRNIFRKCENRLFFSTGGRGVFVRSFLPGKPWNSRRQTFLSYFVASTAWKERDTLWNPADTSQNENPGKAHTRLSHWLFSQRSL